MYNIYPDVFGTDFQTNKQKVQEFTDVKSKIVRNRIAGYLTRYAVIQKTRAMPKIEKTEEIQVE